MATVSVEFDTTTKEISVKVDGKKVNDVQGVSFSTSYMDPDEFCCCITTMSEDETNDMKSYVQMVASDKNPEFQKQEVVSKAQADIAKFFSKK